MADARALPRQAPALAVPPVAVPPAPTLPDLSAGARLAAEAAREARLESRRAPSWQVESVTGTAHRAGPYGHPLQEGRTREPDTGMAWGSLIHFLLEHAMRGPQRDRAHLERLATWFAFDKPELRRVIPEALDTVERVMAAEFWQAAQAAEERAVEVPFAVRVGEAGAPPRLLHGVIDLAFKTAAGWTLIDYKTDQLRRRRRPARRPLRAPDPRLRRPLERPARHPDPRRPPLHPQRRDSLAVNRVRSYIPTFGSTRPCRGTGQARARDVVAVSKTVRRALAHTR